MIQTVLQAEWNRSRCLERFLNWSDLNLMFGNSTESVLKPMFHRTSLALISLPLWLAVRPICFCSSSRHPHYKKLSNQLQEKVTYVQQNPSSLATVPAAVNVYRKPVSGACAGPRSGPCAIHPGRLVGSVKDPGGAVVPGATVTLTNTDEGTSRTTTSNAVGDYRFLDAKAGHYSVMSRPRDSRMGGYRRRVDGAPGTSRRREPGRGSCSAVGSGDRRFSQCNSNRLAHDQR